MKGHAWGWAARPPTISEASAGPEDTGWGWGGERHGGARPGGQCPLDLTAGLGLLTGLWPRGGN